MEVCISIRLESKSYLGLLVLIKYASKRKQLDKLMVDPFE